MKNSVFYIFECGYADSQNYTILNTNLIYVEYVLRGSGIISAQELSQEICAGNLIIDCQSKINSVNNKSGDYKSFYFTAGGAFAHHIAEDYKLLSNIVYNNTDAKMYIERIAEISECRSDRDNDELCRLFLKIASCAAISEDTLTQKSSEHIAEFIKKNIDETIDWNPKIEQICELIHYSKSTVSRAFRRKYGISPYQYIKHRRIETIKEILKTTDIPINDISDAMHICGSNYFSQMFKESVGMTPSEYRKKHRN